jgi:hypothetical protein
MSKPVPAPLNPYASVEKLVPYKPEPTDDPNYQPHGNAPNSYDIAMAVKQVAEEMEQEKK